MYPRKKRLKMEGCSHGHLSVGSVYFLLSEESGFVACCPCCGLCGSEHLFSVDRVDIVESL